MSRGELLKNHALRFGEDAKLRGLVGEVSDLPQGGHAGLDETAAAGMRLAQQEKFLGDAQCAGGWMLLHVAEMFEGCGDPVDGGLRKLELRGEFGLGGSIWARGEGLEEGETALECRGVGAGGGFHG